MDPDRARRALTDVTAVVREGPGIVRVVTFSGEYVVDAAEDRCTCPDQEYRLDDGERCKHQIAALLATSDLPDGVAGEPVTTLRSRDALAAEVTEVAG